MRMLSRISAYFYSLLDFRSRLKYLSHNNETNQWTTPIRNKSPRVSSIFVKYLTFLLLLLCSKTATYSIDAENCRNEYFPSAFESWSIHLLAPIDQAAFGGSLYFAFHLTHHNFIAMDADSPFDDNRYSGSENQSVEIRRLTSEPKIVNFPFKIFINEKDVFSGQLQSTYFDSVLLWSLFTPNASNHIRVEVIVDSRFKIDRSISATVSVNTLPPAKDPAISAIIEVTKSQPNNRRLFNYLFAGFTYCSLLKFTYLDPLRIELFISPSDGMQNNCIESKLTWTTAKIVHDWKQSFKNILNVASFDVGFFMLDGIVEVICRQPPVQSTNSCSQMVVDFILSATQRGKKSLWVFSSMHSQDNANYFEVEKIINLLTNVLLYDEVYFDFEKVGSMGESAIQSGHIRVLTNIHPSQENQIAQWDSYMRNLSSSQSQWSDQQEGIALDGTTELPNLGPGTVNHRELPLASSIIDENYSVGDSYVLLENVCIGRRYISEELKTRGLGEIFVVFFEQNSSTDVTWNGVPNMIAGEDKGFDYIGLDVAKIGILHAKSPLMQTAWPWFEGLTALSTSVSSSHIHHELEPLLKFIYLAGIDRSMPNFIQDHNLSQFLRNRITRLVLGKHSSQAGIDWLESMIGLIMGFYETSLTDLNISAPAVYNFDTLFPVNTPEFEIDTGEPLTKGYCFDQLLLLGRTNSHVKFFGSDGNAQRFKEHVYSVLNISSVSSFAIPQTKVSTAISSPRTRQLKVTIVIRNGRSRRIINIQALQELILGLKNYYVNPPTYLVDKDWLISHVVMLETMTFQEQVRLFVNTDIAISVHGAAIANAMFMRHGSAWIDLFNANYYEYFYSPLFRDSGVGGFYLPITNHTLQTSDCSPDMPDWCAHADEHLNLDCISIRHCSFTVDLHRFRILFSEAYNYVLSIKWIDNSSNKL